MRFERGSVRQLHSVVSLSSPRHAYKFFSTTPHRLLCSVYKRHPTEMFMSPKPIVCMQCCLAVRLCKVVIAFRAFGKCRQLAEVQLLGIPADILGRCRSIVYLRPLLCSPVRRSRLHPTRWPPLYPTRSKTSNCHSTLPYFKNTIICHGAHPQSNVCRPTFSPARRLQ